MSALVTVKNNIPVTTTLEVCRIFEKQHKHILESIDNIDCSEQFRVKNYILSSHTHKHGTSRLYLLTRDGFTFLCMGFKGHKAARWKEYYIQAFNDMERNIVTRKTNSSDPVWLSSRLSGKLARQEETDVIETFIDYAIANGSTNSQYYYGHITNATYKALGLMVQKHPKLRDIMDKYELAEVMLAERYAKSLLIKYMSEGMHYKHIYSNVRDDLQEFGKTLILSSKLSIAATVKIPEGVVVDPMDLI